MAALDDRLAAAGPDFSALRTSLADSVSVLRKTTEWIAGADPVDALAGATPYLRLFGIVLGGWLMARQALAARALLEDAAGDRARFLEAKVVTARYYCAQLLPQAGGLLPAVIAGSTDLLELSPDQF
jgi:hypothetical protein